MISQGSGCFHINLFLVLITFFIAGCAPARTPKQEAVKPTIPLTFMPVSTSTPLPPAISPFSPSITSDISVYAFPDSIDPAKLYLFYLHGKIIEDQGLPAISPDYGEYEYAAILEKLSEYGFVVISEQRSKNTDGINYAQRVVGQVTALLDAGVPVQNITVVGASKGAGITIYVSHLLENPEINYVILAICAPDTVEELIESQVKIYGNVLSIYDSVDELAGSCEDLFAFSAGIGLDRYDEIVLNIGTGHGILYKPHNEWIVPTVKWALNP